MSTGNGKDDKAKKNKDETIAKAAGAVIASGIAWSLFKSFQPKKTLECSEAVTDSPVPDLEPHVQGEKEESSIKDDSITTNYLRKKPSQKFRSKQTYDINKGDTLFSLSRRYGVSIQDLKEANGIVGDNIRAGDTLIIPK
ncbi:hypothetical protein O6H91_14G051500 [Diphasiastrum complanatum]|nr:hypothetical protein O6H91_14G051500 [Diphasiastrum complanatum]